MKAPVGNSSKLRLNAILNGCTRRGPLIGNSAAVCTMFYTTFAHGFEKLRDEDDLVNHVAAGALAGGLFKSTGIQIPFTFLSISISLYMYKYSNYVNSWCLAGIEKRWFVWWPGCNSWNDSFAEGLVFKYNSCVPNRKIKYTNTTSPYYNNISLNYNFIKYFVLDHGRTG